MVGYAVLTIFHDNFSVIYCARSFQYHILCTIISPKKDDQYIDKMSLDVMINVLDKTKSSEQEDKVQESCTSVNDKGDSQTDLIWLCC